MIVCEKKVNIYPGDVSGGWGVRWFVEWEQGKVGVMGEGGGWKEVVRNPGKEVRKLRVYRRKCGHQGKKRGSMGSARVKGIIEGLHVG